MAPRRALPYLVAPGITFLALILEDPTQVQARLNLKMLEILGDFVEALVEEEGLGLQGVLTGFRAMRRVATEAVEANPSAAMTEPTSSYPICTLVSLWRARSTDGD